MISNKALATLFFITFNMQLVASSFPRSTKRPRSPAKFASIKRQKHPSGAGGTVPMLVDTTSAVQDVEATRENIETTSISLEQSASRVKSQFETLIEQGEYEKIFGLGEKMNNEEFLKQLCPVIETLDQYIGVVGFLKRLKMVASFFIHEDIRVIKGAIIESRVYVNDHYVKDGDLETALPLALKEDRHDRVIELLDVRMGITAEKDKLPKQEGKLTNFGLFVFEFLYNLAPWKDGMTLRRFLILCGNEFRNNHPDILDTFCEMLVRILRVRLHLPKAESLLIDLIGQPSLLTPVVFAGRFLNLASDWHRSAFIKHGYRETIQEGLKSEYEDRGKKLWWVMQTERPDKFPGEFPETEEERAAVCAHLPTKQQKENEWIKKYFNILFNQLNNLDFLPDVLWSIISEYAVLFAATMDLTFSTE